MIPIEKAEELARLIIPSYDIGETKQIAQIHVGLINQTWKLDTTQGQFILQKVHPIFAKEVMVDIQAVYDHLRNTGWQVPQIMHTRNDMLYAEDGKQFWRLMTYIPGKVYTTTENNTIAFEAGRILGKFHRDMFDFSHEFRHARPVTGYNVEGHYNAYKDTLAKLNPDETNSVKDLVEVVDGLPQFFLPKLRNFVVHGDAKISNFIFDRDNAISIIDIDDCGNKRSGLYELGDAFRSWCGVEEDDPKNFFNLERFEAGFRGYCEGSNSILTKAETQLLPRAISLIILTLASRFLRDYFEDSYFGWDEKRYRSRKEHNLARTRGQVALFKDIQNKQDDIEKIIKKNARIHHLG